jgi:hypothetical protein
VRRLKKELAQIEGKRKQFTADLDHAEQRIHQTLRELVGGVAKRPQKSTRSKGKRVRRNPEQLKLEAESIFRLIKSKSGSGVKGGEIRKRHPKVGPDIKAFVEKHAGHKVKKAAMRYFPA